MSTVDSKNATICIDPSNEFSCRKTNRLTGPTYMFHVTALVDPGPVTNNWVAYS